MTPFRRRREVFLETMASLLSVLFFTLTLTTPRVKAEADPRGFTEDPTLTEEKFREQGKKERMKTKRLTGKTDLMND